MIDPDYISKVIRGLEASINCECSQCPYIKGDCDGLTCVKLLKDALGLLKDASISCMPDTRLTPRKPRHTKIKYASGAVWITDECPECNERGLGIWDRLIDRFRPFCDLCGQAIDWSEYDEMGGG